MKRLCSIVGLLVFFVLSANSQILYKIEGNGAKAPSYIFGSHHLAPISVVEESGVMEYFNQAEKVVGEIDLTVDQMQIAMALQPFMMAPQDSTLTILLAGEDLDSLNKQFEKYAPMPGMSLQMLDSMKPMVVSTMIASSMSKDVYPGFDPTQQLDSYFFKEGKKENKEIQALETPEYQGNVLFNMTPLTVQAEALIEMLKNPEETIDITRKLSEAYIKRDLNAMIALSKESDEHPEFMENILYKRNADWLTKLPTMIQEKPTFIVVGALHLAGPEGIIEGLREQGFILTPIY